MAGAGCAVDGIVIPGRAKHEPGIHRAASYVDKWIPGSRYARPQMRNCASGNDDKKKGRDRSRPFVLHHSSFCITRSLRPYFASARFGGVAGHDLTRVS